MLSESWTKGHTKVAVRVKKPKTGNGYVFVLVQAQRVWLVAQTVGLECNDSMCF